MANKIHKAPECPSCGKPLNTVSFISYERYTFNPKTNSYENKESWGGSADILCTPCQGDIGDVAGFEDGPINYLSKRIRKGLSDEFDAGLISLLRKQLRGW